MSRIRNVCIDILIILCLKLCRIFSTNGGGVIAVQVENEYGGFGEPDTAYLKWLQNELIQQGIDVLTFTSTELGIIVLKTAVLRDVLMTAKFRFTHRGGFRKAGKTAS